MQTFFPTVCTTVYWRLDSKRSSRSSAKTTTCFFTTAERRYMIRLLKISLILQTILSIVVYTWFATRNCKTMIYKHVAGHDFDIIRQRIRRFGYVYLLATHARNQIDTFGIFFFNTNLYAIDVALFPHRSLYGILVTD